MITHRLRPDAAICIDVTHATDSPGLDKGKFGDIRLGGGPAVIHGTANHPNLVARLEIVADKNKIPLQHEAADVYKRQFPWEPVFRRPPFFILPHS